MLNYIIKLFINLKTIINILKRERTNERTNELTMQNLSSLPMFTREFLGPEQDATPELVCDFDFVIPVPCNKCYMVICHGECNKRHELKQTFEQLDASIAFMKNTLALIVYQIERLMLDVYGITISHDKLDIDTLANHIERLNHSVIGKIPRTDDKMQWLIQQIQRLNMEVYGYDNTDAIDQQRDRMRLRKLDKPKLHDLPLYMHIDPPVEQYNYANDIDNGFNFIMTLQQNSQYLRPCDFKYL